MNRNKLLKILEQDYNEQVLFSPGETYFWSPKDQTVHYQEDDSSSVGSWSLLHELCHGLLEHKKYKSDFELVLLEAAAWEKAKEIARKYRINIDDNYIQDCLDSYRDWQYKRSICPTCELGGIQINNRTYTCILCAGIWSVSNARFCRPYRRKLKNSG